MSLHFTNFSKFFLRGALNQTQSKSKFEKHVSCSEDLHKNKSQNETLKTRIRLVISYHRGAPNVSSITKKHWSILQINDNLSTSFENRLDMFQANIISWRTDW